MSMRAVVVVSRLHTHTHSTPNKLHRVNSVMCHCRAVSYDDNSFVTQMLDDLGLWACPEIVSFISTSNIHIP